MNILTFDLEEWFHCDMLSGDDGWDSHPARFEGNMDRIVEALQQRRLKATFFCLGWIVRRFPSVIRRLGEMGHELGCHSDMHLLVTRMSREAFSGDSERAIKTLEDLTGAKVRAYRAPAFSITTQSAWAFEELARLGIEVDCSVFPARRDFGGFPELGLTRPGVVIREGVRLREFPMSVVKVAQRPVVFSGGGYFRLFPYAMIQRWTRMSDYVMAYFHPRDFDPGQPVMPNLPAHRRFKSYYGLRGCFRKFEKWLDDFRFVSLGQAEAEIDWRSAPEACLDVVRTGR